MNYFTFLTSRRTRVCHIAFLGNLGGIRLLVHKEYARVPIIPRIFYFSSNPDANVVIKYFRGMFTFENETTTIHS